MRLEPQARQACPPEKGLESSGLSTRRVGGAAATEVGEHITFSTARVPAGGDGAGRGREPDS